MLSHDDIKSEFIASDLLWMPRHKAEDQVREYAESLLPVYNADVIREWTAMDGSFDDSWRDFYPDGNVGEFGIVQLMLLDLMNYYSMVCNQVWEELLEEHF